ncbi:hypothetical protein QH494_23745 [Sphingomonas sp. AR_OL41]|uniref:hypothetical protein n=1 Tax=Sphingomonas sp. AR_OL41 TaxID=3042729 RepID=UPI002480C33B|nr:hypothetical protein [Sphingomonas sp. AR_OL41]MDH7975209.1 hypothetical protein [Sphingomonas sp. AR_OL41]
MKQIAALLVLCLSVAGCSRHRTYAEGCGPLPRDWITPRQGRGVESLINVIAVAADGSVSFNGAGISRPILATYLKQSSAMFPAPVTQIKFAPTVDCATVQSLRRLMASALDCKYGKCSEGNEKWWFIGDVVFNGQSPEPYDPDASPLRTSQR